MYIGCSQSTATDQDRRSLPSCVRYRPAEDRGIESASMVSLAMFLQIREIVAFSAFPRDDVICHASARDPVKSVSECLSA